jgi:hypothetical protein
MPLLILTVLAMAPLVHAQSAATGVEPTQPASSARQPKTAHPARRSHRRHALPARATGAAHASSPASGPAGVLALGASDITGNKELPKVMVIVPWKDSLGAGGVIKPEDSLLDDVLQPVDRGVFQRQIRYYGQLDAAAAPPAASRVAPVGDSH